MRNFQNISTTLVLASCILSIGLGQDINFSQHNLSSAKINPALTGAFDGAFRVMVDEREQYSDVLRSAPYNARSISLDTKKEFQSGSYIGFGISRYKDSSGELDFGETELATSVAFSKCFSKDPGRRHYISLGGKVGKETRRVDLTNARWPSQHDGNGGWITEYQIPISGFRNEVSATDLNLGISWLGFINERVILYLGFAAHHITRPNVSFLEGSNEKLNRLLSLQGGGELSITETFYLSPYYLLLKQGDFKEGTIGLSAGYKIGAEQNFIQISSYKRFSSNTSGGFENSVVGLGFAAGCRGFIFGMAYDHSLSPEFFDGVYEASVGYILGGKNLKRSPFIKS